MKKCSLFLVLVCFLVLNITFVKAQESSKNKKAPVAMEEDEGPIMFRFEPDFISQNEKKKAEIAITRSIIDTLDISDRKRLKLLKDLYKNGMSKRLQKAMLVENSFEDEDIEQ